MRALLSTQSMNQEQRTESKENRAMTTNDLSKAIATEREMRPELRGDGFEDEARADEERLIRGRRVKFVSPEWLRTDETTPITGRVLVVTAIAATWDKWWDGEIVDQRVRPSGGFLPDRDELECGRAPGHRARRAGADDVDVAS
jgi:hypothetical protein